MIISRRYSLVQILQLIVFLRQRQLGPPGLFKF
jgi:hypothetical protein